MAVVQITQEHINAGKKANCTSCPIALALRDGHIPSEYSVHVRVGVVHVISTAYNTFRTLLLGDVAKRFVERFDLGLLVEPFRFEMDIELPSSVDDGHQCDNPLEFDDL